MLIAETPQRAPDPSRPPGRPWWTKASGAQILMVVAGIVAFLANLVVLRSGGETVEVAIAAVELVSGARLDPGSDIDWIELGATTDEVASLVTVDEIDELTAGRILAASVGPGDLLLESDLIPESASGRARAFSIPIRTESAVGGALSAGDRIDVVAVQAGRARYVVTGIEVLAVPGDQRGAFSTSGAFFVTVAVDDVQVLELSEAMASGDIAIVRSTGAPPPAVSSLSETAIGRRADAP